MLINTFDHIEAPFPVGSGGTRVLLGVAPQQSEFAGADRLRSGNADITGIHAHAAVRMHAFPVTGAFWAYCPKPKTTHFQRWKVAL